MRGRANGRALLVIAAAAVGIASIAIPGLAGSAAAAPPVSQHAVCPRGGDPAGFAHCHAHVRDHGPNDPTPLVSTSPYGLDPAVVKQAYGFPTDSTAGAGKTIAIVDAYDDPTAENDLSVFSSQFGLPSCTTANSCFSKVNQSGGTSYPTSNGGWALEISLDVQWAHAIAPGAHILLVEATTNSFSNLFSAVLYAKAHANYVSMSWGGGEFSGETTYDSYFSQAGVSFFVSAGDSGLPAEYPSASKNVVSVGGTTLNGITVTNGVGTIGATFSETAWSSGGGGCSSFETATSAQSAFATYSQVGCSGRRATPDVSLDADPASGVSVYDTTPYNGASGWWQVGGTSASAPMWAGRSADLGSTVDASLIYGASAPRFRDITSGNNGAPALVGFDLATGRGSWADSDPTGSTTTTSSSSTTTSSTTTSTSSTSTTTTTLAGGLTASITSEQCGTSGAVVTCNFAGTSNNASAAPSWNFGNGLTSQGSWTVSSGYTKSGTFTVTLTASLNGQAATATATVSCSWATTGRNKTVSCTAH